MKIEDGLIQINKSFERLHHDFMRIDQDIAALEGNGKASRSGIAEKFDARKQALITLKEEVLKFYRIAQENSSQALDHSASPMQPDLAKLNDLVMRINQNDRNDYTAGQIIRLASSYVVYIERDLQKLSNEEQKEQTISKDQQSKSYNSLQREKLKIFARCEDYLKSGEVAELSSLFGQVNEDYCISADDLSNWNGKAKRKRKLLFGYQQYPIDVPTRLVDVLKQSLGEHFDVGTKHANCPIGFDLNNSAVLHIEYSSLNEGNIRHALQGLIINFIRTLPITDYKVTLLDYVHFSGDLVGQLSVLSQTKNGLIAPIPHDEHEIKQTISLLVAYYKKVEIKTQNESVFEYNTRHAPNEHIPLRTIIIVKDESIFTDMPDPSLSYLLNNARKFGLNILQLRRTKECSKGRDKEKKAFISDPQHFSVICADDGSFYIQHGKEWYPFKWLEAPDALPDSFINMLLNMTAPVKRSNKYFERFPAHLPEKSKGKRRPIELPFATDEDGNVITCSFERDAFAAYIMGAAGSGKSTLLHTLICGLLMNYHPDEVELWLLDFKMLEFKRYATNCPPHVKYVLLEKSEDLIFDIINKLTEELDRRQALFSLPQNNWSKLTDVPVEKNIPAIFIIIDEFAQMSQIIKDTKGEGAGKDYTIKLENLLTKGRALGIKFIFSSQTYTTGVSGLTETACKQIQLRFALKNTALEIKETLNLTSNDITPELSHEISTLPEYDTIFKWRDMNGEIRIGRYHNMYAEDGELLGVVSTLKSKLHAVSQGITDNTTYLDKKPVLIDGNTPQTFKSQIMYYKEYEAALDDELDDDDILVYAGVPCSFNRARPFILSQATAENMLITGGERDNRISALLSVLHCYKRTKNKISLWANQRAASFKKYKATVLSLYHPCTNLEDICEQILTIKKDIQRRQLKPGLICIMGYEAIVSELEILGENNNNNDVQPQPADDSTPSMDDILRIAEQTDDPEERRRIINDYNQRIPVNQGAAAPARSNIYDARADLEWIIKQAPAYGLHFLVCLDNAGDFANLRMPEKAFKHKILFSVSKDDSLDILHNRKANELEEGTCVYSNGIEMYTMRPHIHRGVPCGAWIVDENGAVVQRG